MDWIFFLTGIVAGGIVVYLVTVIRSRNLLTITREEKGNFDRRISDLEVENRVVSNENKNSRETILKLEQLLEDEKQKLLSISTSLATKEADLKNLKEKLETHRKEVEEMQEKFNIHFRNLANEILEEKSKKFTDQNKLNISEILNPLKEKILEFERKVEQTNKESIERNSSLKEQILGLRELNQRITKDAENLTRALKGETKTQGNWGEFILESILEKSGLVKNREYFLQESFVSPDGRRYQPDVVIKLPESKNLIIDAKVSLVAYERYVNSEDENERKDFVKSHILSVRSHIKLLSEKNYQDLGVPGLDFVLLFMPVEPAFGLALQHDDQLFLHAYEKNIVLVSPSTLIATLRTISSIWRQEYQNQNVMEIARQGGDLYDKFVNFTNDLIQLGDRMASTQKSYDEAMKKLSTGTGNLVSRTEKLKKLGAKVKNSIDQKLLGKAAEEES